MNQNPNQNKNQPDMSLSPAVESALFPRGTTMDPDQRKDLIDQYKLLQQSGDQLAGRRQNVNSFFLSLNSILLASTGVLAKELLQGPHHRGLTGIMLLLGVIALTGLIACRNWSVLIHSYGQLLMANETIITLMEKALPAAPVTAQKLLADKDPVSLTRTENNIARTFLSIYAFVSIVAAVGMVWCWHLPTIVELEKQERLERVQQEANHVQNTVTPKHADFFPSIP